VSQDLFSSSILSESILKSLKKAPKRTLKNMETIRDLSRTALKDIRAILYELVPEQDRDNKLADLLVKLFDVIKDRHKLVAPIGAISNRFLIKLINTNELFKDFLKNLQE
jgi:signal transduction histidine kinase